MKAIYSMMLAAMVAGTASAQTAKMYEGVNFSKLSNNGKWLIENTQGTFTVYNRTTEESFSCSDPDGMKMYMPGLGRSITDDGKLVGMCDGNAGICVGGEWTYLPQPTGVGSSYNTAHAITPDENRIVGILGNNGASMGGDGLMAYPVIWTKNSAGEYECNTLPYPSVDFLGKTPQYVTAISIADDGKTIAGQVRDNSGFYVMPIVWREQTDGTWAYSMLGESEIYDKSRLGELPEYPVTPVSPNVGDYMTQADADAYNNALEEYNEKVQLYYDGLLDEWPEYPKYEDYISDATRKQAYLDAMEKYNADQQKYMSDLMAYQAKLDEITTQCGFTQNSLFLSANGRYLGTTLEDRSKQDGWGGGIEKYIGYFDVWAATPSFIRVTKGGDYLITGILNDATTFIGTPAMEYTRNTFVVKPSEDAKSFQTLTLPKYVESRNADMAKWITDNNTYDVTVWGYDDNWNQIIEDVVKDSLVCGTVTANPEGTILLSYYTDQFTSTDEARSLSYVIDFNTPAGIHGVSYGREQRFGATVSGRNVVAGATTAKMEIFDMAGRKLNADPAARSVALKEGVYMVHTTDADGSEATRKVVVK